MVTDKLCSKVCDDHVNGEIDYAMRVLTEVGGIDAALFLPAHVSGEEEIRDVIDGTWGGRLP